MIAFISYTFYKIQLSVNKKNMQFWLEPLVSLRLIYSMFLVKVNIPFVFGLFKVNILYVFGHFKVNIPYVCG